MTAIRHRFARLTPLYIGLLVLAAQAGCGGTAKIGAGGRTTWF